MARDERGNGCETSGKLGKRREDNYLARDERGIVCESERETRGELGERRGGNFQINSKLHKQ